MHIRPAAVAGMFYPDDPRELRLMVNSFLQQSAHSSSIATSPKPKVLVVPHAGYVYSGQTAAAAYSLLQAHGRQIKRVILLGPCHRVAVRGMALPDVHAFATPLGSVPLDIAAMEKVKALPFVSVSNIAHAQEHSLEVHLPFLQTVLEDFVLIPWWSAKHRLHRSHRYWRCYGEATKPWW